MIARREISGEEREGPQVVFHAHVLVPRAAVTHFHKPSGLKHEKLILLAGPTRKRAVRNEARLLPSTKSLFVTMDGGLRRSLWAEAGRRKPSRTARVRLATRFSGLRCSASSRKPVLRPRHLVIGSSAEGHPARHPSSSAVHPMAVSTARLVKTANRDPN